MHLGQGEKNRVAALIRCHQISSPFFSPNSMLLLYWDWHRIPVAVLGCRPYQRRPDAGTKSCAPASISIVALGRMSSRWSFKRKDKIKWNTESYWWRFVGTRKMKSSCWTKNLSFQIKSFIFFFSLRIDWMLGTEIADPTLVVRVLLHVQLFPILNGKSPAKGSSRLVFSRNDNLTHSAQLDTASFIGVSCGWRPADNPIMSGIVPHNNVEHQEYTLTKIIQELPIPIKTSDKCNKEPQKCSLLL